MRGTWLLLALVVMGSSSFAELRLPAVFSEGMVLQRDNNVAVRGWADPGAEVAVRFAGGQEKTNAGADGRFMVRLKPMAANAQPQSLIVTSGAETVEIGNVLVGEVWLCSGQSNMGMRVKKAKDYEKEQAAANHPLIRMFLTDRKASLEPREDCTGAWNVCAPKTVGEFSATAYFFGREIQRELNVPVGLILSAWGGTGIEAWSPLASLEEFPTVMADKAERDAEAEGFDVAAEEARFNTLREQWKVDAKEARSSGGKPPKWPKKKVHPHEDQNYPANLYNAMIHPHVPYGIRGAIWYQGERNSHSFEDAVLYRDLLENLVSEWREDFGADVPFYAVQLVNFRKPQVEPVEDTGWVFIRESFLKFHKEVPDVGIAVGIDVGEADNIHPKNKQAIGYRLARQALAKTYGKKVVAGGPIYRSRKKEDGKIVIRFEDVGSGLVSRGGGPLKTFAIAGSDRRFVAAQAVIRGDTVVVSSDGVADPVAVRYAWADNPVGCNLYNSEGFPASPFRTDNWPPKQ